MRESIDVEFDVECDDFTVRAMYGLEFSATYEVVGYVRPDNSGDSVTPNGPPEVNVGLMAVPKAYEIALDGCLLPKWLQEHLSVEFATEMDDAFLEAIGGQSKLDELAVEKALA